MAYSSTFDRPVVEAGPYSGIVPVAQPDMSPMPAPDSLYSAMASSPDVAEPIQRPPLTAVARGEVNYVDAERRSAYPRVGRLQDPIMQLDADPTGAYTAEWAKQTGASVDSTVPLYLNVFGRAMPREQLEETEAGRKLLDLAIKGRRGSRRGFLEAVTDLSWADAPFMSLVAGVGKSFADAVTASDTMKKLQNGEPVTDDELIKTRLFMAEGERQSGGTFGALVGEIVRAAPGFMAEFLLTGGAFSGVRLAASKGLAGSAKWTARLAVNRATKTLAGELAAGRITEQVAAKGITKEAGRVAFSKAVRDLAGDSVARNTIRDEMAAGLVKYVQRSGVSADMAPQVAQYLADRALTRRLAYEGASSAYTKFARGAAESLREWTARGLLDVGHFGSTTSTTMFANQNSAGRALVDALGAFTVEAHIRGLAMMVPALGVKAGLGALGAGKDGRLVSRNTLSIQESALRQDNPQLMAMAEAVGLGADAVEYISENAGRGFRPFLRSIGLATGVSKAAPQVIKAGVGGILEETKKLEAGGFFRSLLRKALGTPEQYAERAGNQRVASAMELLNKELQAAGKPAVGRDAVARMVSARSSASLPASAAAIVGNDVDAFVKRAVSAAYDGELETRLYKTLGRYRLADWMARKGYGPDRVMDLWEEMGYDGILGEMFEERYGDFEKGLFGLDDKTGLTMFERAKTAIKSLYPGFDQLLAEAIGFAVPGLSRNAALLVQKSVAGGQSELDTARNTSRSIATAFDARTAVQLPVSEFVKAMDQGIASLQTEARDARIAANRAAAELNPASTAEEQQRVASLEQTALDAKARLDRQVKHKSDVLAANNIDEAVAAETKSLLWAPVVRSSERAEDFAGDKARPRETSEQVAADYGDAEFAREHVADLGMALVQASRGTGGVGFWRWAVGKAAGVAAAVVTADPSLAFRRAASWAAVDEGLPRMFVDELHSLAAKHYRDAYDRLKKRNTESDVPGEEGATYQVREEDILAEARRTLGPEAEQLFDDWMGLKSVRFAASGSMLARAVGIYAKSNGMTLRDDGAYVRQDGTVVTEDELSKDEQVLEIRDKIARGTFAGLTGVTENSILPGYSFFSMPQGKPGEEAVLAAVRRSMGRDGFLIPKLELDPSEDIGDALARAGYSIDYSQVSRVVELANSGQEVPDELIASLAADAGYPKMTGTDAEIARMRKSVVDFSRGLMMALAANQAVRVYRAKENPGEDDRLGDWRGETIIASRTAEGWSVTLDKDSSVASEGPSRKTVVKQTAEEMDAYMREAKYEYQERPIVLVESPFIESRDGVALARQLGIARAVHEDMSRQADQRFMVPEWRREGGEFKHKDSGSSDAAKDAELALAWFFWSHGEDKAPDYAAYDALLVPDARGNAQNRVDAYEKARDAYAALFGESGYYTVLHRHLSAAGVVCPSVEGMMSAYEGGRRPAYAFRVKDMAAVNTGNMPIVIPVDFRSGQDYSSAFGDVVAGRAVDSNIRMFTGKESPFRDAAVAMAMALRQVIQAETLRSDVSKRVKADMEAISRSLFTPKGDLRRNALVAMVRNLSMFAPELAQDSEGVSSARHAGWLHLAPLARNRREFLTFYAMSDLIFGGDGFGMALAGARMGDKTTSPSDYGLLSVVRTLGDMDGPALKKALAELKPAGLTVKEFMAEVSKYATDIGVELPAVVPGASGGTTSLSGMLRFLTESLKLNGLPRLVDFFSRLQGATKKTDRNVSSLAEEYVRAIEAEQNHIDQLVSELQEAKSSVDKLRTDKEVLEKENTEFAKSLQSLREGLTKNVNIPSVNFDELAAKARDADTKASVAKLRERWARLTQEANEATQALKQLHSGLNAGETAETPGAPEDGSPKANPGRRTRRRKNLTPVTGGIDFTTEARLVPDANGLMHLADLPKIPTDLTARTPEAAATRRVGCGMLQAAGWAMGAARGEKLSFDDFKKAARALFGYSIRDAELDALWDEYLRDKRPPQYFSLTEEDPAAAPEDNEPEVDETASATDAYGVDKARRAYDNDAMARFLTFASAAAPLTGREFQGLCVSLRDGLVAAREAYERELRETKADTYDPAITKALDLMDHILNPRSMIGDAGRSDPDRAAHHEAYMRELDGMASETLSALLSPDRNGRPVFRLGAFLLSYLQALSAPARTNMMTLISSSVSVSLGSIVADQEKTKDEDGAERTRHFLRMELQQTAPRAPSVRAMASTFLQFISGKLTSEKAREAAAQELQSAASAIEAACRAAKWKNYSAVAADAVLNASAKDKNTSKQVLAKNARAVNVFQDAVLTYWANAQTLADVLSGVLGADSPFVQILRSEPTMRKLLLDVYSAEPGRNRDPAYVNSKRFAIAVSPRSDANHNVLLADETGATYTNVVPLAYDIISILRALARECRSGITVSDETVERVVVAAFSFGVDSSEGLAIPHKQLSATPIWNRMFSEYLACMPQTLTRADVLEERSSKTDVTLPAAAQGLPPALRQWLDGSASQVGSFAWYAYHNLKFRDLSRFADVKTEDDFDLKVMPYVRQNMVWPDSFHTPILFRSRARDYNKMEATIACREQHDRRVKTNLDMSWLAPVYNGEHSSGLYLRIPRSLVVRDKAHRTDDKADPISDYTDKANMILADAGLEQLGRDAKRAMVTSTEAPARAMYGVRHNADGTVDRGHCYVHVPHNYRMDAQDSGSMKGQSDHADALLGNIPVIGYGAAVQRAVAKDPRTLIGKYHFSSATGDRFTFIKGLTVTRSDGTSYHDGAVQEWMMDGMESYAETKPNSDLSTHMGVDEDAFKLGTAMSKSMGVVGPDGNTVTLLGYFFARMKPEAEKEENRNKKSWTLDELEAILDDGSGEGFLWREPGKADRRVKLGELLGQQAYSADGVALVDAATGHPQLDTSGIEAIRMDDGKGGNVVDLVFMSDGLMSFKVANVSHECKPSIGRMPRNNVIDAITMAAIRRRGAGVVDKEQAGGLIDLVADYGLAVAAMTTDPSFVDSVRRTSKRLADLELAGGVSGSRDYENQLAYDVFSRQREVLPLPLYGVQMPLESSGAVYDEGLDGGYGGVVDQSTSPFLRFLNKGSRVFSDKRRDQKFNGISRRLAACRMNVHAPHFRYMWATDKDALEKAFAVISEGDEAVKTAKPADDMAMIEYLVTRVHEADLEYQAARLDDMAYSDDELAELAKRSDDFRQAFLGAFVDHHGVSVLYTPVDGCGREYHRTVCFDDLFVENSRGERVFDRSAVYDGKTDEDRVPEPDNATTGHVWLMGTAVGLPRTPSYNGSMWLQTVRASVPASEDEVENGRGWDPKFDAAIMPDPQTLKILGCDHDGDKAFVYMLSADPDTGVADGTDLTGLSPMAFEGDLSKFASDPAERARHLARLVDSGVLSRGTEGGALGFTEYSERGDGTAYGVADQISNGIVQSLLDLSRALPVDRPPMESSVENADGTPVTEETVREGRKRKMLTFGWRDYDFYNTRWARATKATPLSGERWEQLKKLADESKNYLKNSVIADVWTGAAVSTSAGSADKARGVVVSLAGMLHLAQFSGKFSEGSGVGVLFGWDRANVDRWVDFMYAFDGISNATFDDIKDQICLRLGWEPGLMESMLADIVARGVHPPASGSAEDVESWFYDALSEHIKEITSKGPRFWASMSANPATDGDLPKWHATINGYFVEFPGTDMSVRSDDVRRTFGIKLVGDRYELDEKATGLSDAASKFRDALHDSVQKAVAAGGADSKVDLADEMDSVLRELVAGVASRRGSNPSAGFVAWALSSIANGGSAEDAADRYFAWAGYMRVVRTAQSFGKSINFLKADPASAEYVAGLERGNKTFETVMADGPESDVDGVLAKMHAATMALGQLPEIGTTKSRAKAAELARDDTLARLARFARTNSRASKTLRTLVAKLVAADGLRGAMRQEASTQTLPYVLAAMQTMPAAISGDDVMSGEGGLQAWDTLETIAKAVAGESNNGAFSTLDLCDGIVAMFNVLATLHTSSTSAVRLPAYGYFNTRDEYAGKSAHISFASSKRYLRGHTPYDLPVRIIGANYRARDLVSADRARRYVGRIMSGELDKAPRTPLYQLSGTDHATSFVLSVENLDALAKEGKLDHRLQTDVTLVRNILESLGKDGKPVVITPSSFMTQFLPLYAVMTSRVAGAPSEKSRSVLGLLPGVYERLVRQQKTYASAWFDPTLETAVGHRLMDAVELTNTQMPDAVKSEYAARGKNGSAGWRDRSAGQFTDEAVAAIVTNVSAIPPENVGRDVRLADMDMVSKSIAGLWGSEQTPSSPVRSNPERRNLVDVFGNGGLLRTLHEYANERMAGATYEDVPDAGATPEETTTDQAEVENAETLDERTKKFAELLPLALSDEAMVKAVGPGTFTVSFSGGLRGAASKRFGGGNQTWCCITVRVRPKTGQRKFVPLDPNSPAVAASFVEAVPGIGITADEFLTRFTVEERQMMLDRFIDESIYGKESSKSLSVPAWSIDGKGMALLCGEIVLGENATDRTLFHEYFHSMVSMFRSLGVWGEDDIKSLRKMFPGGSKSTGELFNEELAADEFADYALRRVAHNREKLSVFQKIFRVLKALMNSLRKAFGYEDNDARDMLFDMVLSGYAAMSSSRVKELFGKKYSLDEEAANELARHFMDAGGDDPATVEAKRLLAGEKMRESMEREMEWLGPRAEAGNAEAEAAERMAAQEEPWPDPMAGHESVSSVEDTLSALLKEELSRDATDKDGNPRHTRMSAVRELARALSSLRGGEAPEGLRTPPARLRLVPKGMSDVQRTQLRQVLGVHSGENSLKAPPRLTDDERATLEKFAAMTDDELAADRTSFDEAYRIITEKLGAPETHPDMLGTRVSLADELAADRPLRELLATAARMEPGGDVGSVRSPWRSIMEAALSENTLAAILGIDTFEGLREAIRGKQTFAEKMAGYTRLKSETKQILRRVEATVANGVSLYKTLSGREGLDENLLYRAVLHTISRFNRAAKDSVEARYRSFGVGGDLGTVMGKLRVTANDIAGALTAYSGKAPSDIVGAGLARLRDLRRAYADEEGTADIFDKLEEELARLDIDVTEILSDPAAWRHTLDSVMSSVYAGIRRGAWSDAEGRYMDYVEANEEVSDAATDNRQLYGLSGGGRAAEAAQAALNAFAETAFTAAACVKFCRETGVHPGSFHDNAFTGVPVPESVPLAEVLDEFGIGASHVVSDDPMFDLTNGPEFAMANIDSWSMSLLPKSLGRTDVRELMMNNPSMRKFRAAIAKLTRTENFEAAYIGISRGEHRKLFRLHEGKSRFEYGEGFYHTTDDGRDVVKFDVYGNDTVDVEFTLDEYRVADLFLKSLRVRLNHGRKYLTGSNNLSFMADVTSRDMTGRLSRLPSVGEVDTIAEGPDALQERIDETLKAENTAEVPSYMSVINRFCGQWFKAVLGVDEVERGSGTMKFGMGMYGKLVDGVKAALTKANAIAQGDDEGKLRLKMERETGRQMTANDYNDIVLGELEARGLVVCDFEDNPVAGGKTYTGGSHRRRSATIVLDCAEIERVFRESSAFDKLTKDAGRSADWLRGDAIIGRYMAPYKEALAAVAEMPWLTEGDGMYMHNIGTALPFMCGGGGFMYRANRAARDMKLRETVRLGRHEQTFYRMLDLALRHGDKGVADASHAQLDMLVDYFNLPERGDALRRSILAGKYAPGTEGSLATGLELPSTAYISDMARQIYFRQMSLRLDALEGKPASVSDGTDAIDRMLQAYRDTTGTLEGATAMALGATDEMMFRKYGLLPANAQIGHAMHSSLSGIMSALSFRAALANMMFLRNEDGTPVCYVKPSEDAVARGGLPDTLWGATARWWAKAFPGVYAYDEAKSGVENARDAYDKLADMFGKSGSMKVGARPVHALAPDEIDAPSVSAFMALGDAADDENVSKLSRIGTGHRVFDGGEAIGYARHLLQTSRVLGSGAKMQWVQRCLSWSKAASVAYSWFFPLATRWESPTGAVGFLATLGSNMSPSFVRKHAKALNRLQKMFTLGMGDGWLDENFIGTKDILQMMDSNDPFLADLVTWAELLGITMTDRLSNPLEPSRGMVEADIRHMADLLGKDNPKLGARFKSIMDGLFLRSGEKAFTYALNATKLAVTCQLAMKLRAEAKKAHKAFDPIRDLAKYANYIDSEIGGVNPLRYAWAHPMMRQALNCAFFSWEWTRTAWEAGGGTLFEDILFGGHTFTKQERKYMVGRWLRMFGSIMIGVPMFFQFFVKLIALALGRDDDEDKWWTWENEDKTKWTSADITPILKALGNRQSTVGYAVTQMKKIPLLGSLVPAYTGTDEANSAGANDRRYYIHMGKQGWEFLRWFTDGQGQLFGKLSMPMQRILEGLSGRNMSYLDRELPFSRWSTGQRFVDVFNPEGVYANFFRAFVPFSVNGVGTFGDAGFLSLVGSVQMGTSQTQTTTKIKDALRAWATNDRSAYRFSGKHPGQLRLLDGILEDARRNGHDPDFLVREATGQIASELYGKLFKVLPKSAKDDYDPKEVERCMRALRRLGVAWKGVRQSVSTRLDRRKTPLAEMHPDDRRAIQNALLRAWRDPYGTRRIDY